MAEMNNGLQVNNGKITCNKNILQSIISLATKEISGVASMQDTFSMKLKRLVNKSDSTGVKIKFSTNGLLTIDVYVRIFSGNKVPEIAYKIQENIKNNIISMVDMRVNRINVHIIGVDFKEEQD